MEPVFVIMLLLAAQTFAAADVLLDFRVTPSIVVPSSSTNMTLICNATQEALDDNHKNLSSLKILKNHQNGWKILAQLTDMEPSSVHLIDQSPIASSGDISHNYPQLGHLIVTWDRPSPDSYGQYMCVATKLDIQKSAIFSRTASLSIGSDLKPQDLLLLMSKDKAEVREKIQGLVNLINLSRQNLQPTDITDLQNLQGELNQLVAQLNETLEANYERLESLESRLVDYLNDTQRSQQEKIEYVNSRLQVLLKRGFLTMWPQGTYGLPKTATGCPSDVGGTWTTSYRKHHTESSGSTGSNRDELSSVNHLEQPIILKESDHSFVYQRFCVRHKMFKVGPTWPSGSYCINRVRKCPAGFHNGSIQWDDENTNSRTSTSGQLPDSDLSGHSVFFYCCREDGSAEEPVHLPLTNPFYLYRHGGQCQKVAGMNVAEEFIRFDTESSDNRDAAFNQHPDVEIEEGILLHLCYYS